MVNVIKFVASINLSQQLAALLFDGRIYRKLMTSSVSIGLYSLPLQEYQIKEAHFRCR